MNTSTSERKTVLLSQEMAFKGKALRAAEGAPYAEGVKIDIERPQLLTESYKMTEGEPMVIRRAKAIAHILDNMTIYIQPWERIVGNFASDPDAIQYYPELFSRWVDRAIDGPYSHMVSDEERRLLLGPWFSYRGPQLPQALQNRIERIYQRSRRSTQGDLQ
jgi:pyruvate-formate lyase